MTFYLLVGLDLEDLTQEQRQRLKAGLPMDWKQVGAQSIWWARFDGVEAGGVSTRALDAIVRVARAAGVDRLPAVLMQGTSPPVLATDVLIVQEEGNSGA